MYRITTRLQSGREIIANFFNPFETSNFDHTHNRICDEKSAPPSKASLVNQGDRQSHYAGLLAFLAIGIFCFGMLGCGGAIFERTSSRSSSGAAALAASPSSVDFGTVTIGNSRDQKLSLSNTGSEPLQITRLTLSNSAFSIKGQGSLPVKLAAGSSLDLSVHYSPKDTTSATGKLTVNAISSSLTTLSSTVKLQGKGAKTATLSTLSCASTSITGAASDACLVTLSSAATGSGLAVNLSSSSKAIKVPSSVTVASGATTAGFVASVSAVTSSQTVTLTAKQGSVSKSTSIKLNKTSTSSASLPSVTSLSCAGSSFTGAATTNCTVTLTSAALSGGMGVSLASNNSAVSLPGSVTVAFGATTATFTANVASVSTSQAATITASANSSSRSYGLQLNAATSSLSLSTASLAFGNVAVGTAVTKSVTVTSNGTVAVTINSDAITGAGFSVSGGGFPVTLKPGQAAVLTVQYAPGSAGSVSGQLTISSSAPVATISLSGTGTTIPPTVSGLSCSSLSITGLLLDACTVSLSGSAPSAGVSVALASSNSAVVVPGTITVPATASSGVFTANVAAVTSAQSVTLTATTGGTSKSISLQLNAATAILSVNATNISFGSTTLNNPITQSLTLSSTGTAGVTINSVTVTGTGFSLSGATLPVTLSPGQSMNITVQFDPTTTGSATGLVTISSNSPSNPTTVVTLSGTGSVHQVSLTWNAPSSSVSPIAGYNVYRAASGSSTYQLLNSALDLTTTYSDATVQSGQSYDYVVKTVDTAGTESGPSNVTTVVIP